MAAELIADDRAASQMSSTSYMQELIALVRANGRARFGHLSTIPAFESQTRFGRRMEMLMRRQGSLPYRCTPLRRAMYAVSFVVVMVVSGGVVGVTPIEAQTEKGTNRARLDLKAPAATETTEPVRVGRFVKSRASVTLSMSNTGQRVAVSPVESVFQQFLFIEFGSKANQQLSEDFHGYQGNNLKPLPRGKHEFAGTPFVIADGMIQLASKRAPDYPESVEGINVGATCTHIHFLHGSGWGSPGVADGTPLGHYAVHYEDGTADKIPIVYGEDVRDWWQLADTKGASRAIVAWTGTNDASKSFRGRQVELRLFMRTWDNPKPRVKIDNLAFHSLNASVSAPFCVGITIETRPNERAAIKVLRERNGYVRTDEHGHAVAVSLTAGRATRATLSELSHLRHLTQLDLSNNRLNQAEWDIVSELIGIRSLTLNRTNTDDKALALLARWSRLEQLRLYDTSVTDAGLKHIVSLSSLKELDLSETAISDAGMEHLWELRDLTKLDLRGTEVSERGVDFLKHALSKCIVKR